MKTSSRSTLIRNRLIECIEKGELSYSDELHLLRYFINRHNPISVTEYAKQENITLNGAKDRIKRKKVAALNMIGRDFVFYM